MYWDYSETMNRVICRTAAENLLGKPHKAKVLVLTERGGQHGGFTDAGSGLAAEGVKGNFSITEINNTRKNITEACGRSSAWLFRWIFRLALGRRKRKIVRQVYRRRPWRLDRFPSCYLLGEFDGYPMWQWFSRFHGWCTFQELAPQATVLIVEDKQHPQ